MLPPRTEIPKLVGIRLDDRQIETRGVTIMKKIKDILFSEKGMKIVNVLFLLSMLFYKSGLLFIAYIAWIAYLAFCIKHTDSKGSKIIYSSFIGIAAIMICLNLYFLLRR